MRVILVIHFIEEQGPKMTVNQFNVQKCSVP